MSSNGGRYRKEHHKKLTCSVDVEVDAKLREQATVRDRPVSWLVNQILKGWLKDSGKNE